MQLGSSWNRRGFLGTAAALVASLVAPRKLHSRAKEATGSAKVSGFGETGNPYEELGVSTVINCQGTMTMLGGSILRPELEAVMAMAGGGFVCVSPVGGAAGE